MRPRNAALGGWKYQIRRVGRTRAVPLGASVEQRNVVKGVWACQSGCGGRTWAVPLGPLVKLPIVPRSA
eukprot:1792013-Pyramimonas_sp.AAC.1